MRVKAHDDTAAMLTIQQVADPSLLTTANALAKEVTGSSSSGMRERLMNAKANIFWHLVLLHFRAVLFVFTI